MRCAIGEGLEGSRFGVHIVTLATFASSSVEVKRVRTGGSREEPSASQLYGSDVSESKSTGLIHRAG
jgi:hypothetical protein